MYILTYKSNLRGTYCGKAEKRLLPLLTAFDKVQKNKSGENVTCSAQLALKKCREILTTSTDQKMRFNEEQLTFELEKPVNLLVLPKLSKILLVSSFIASFNPPATDAQYFLRVCFKIIVYAHLSTVGKFPNQIQHTTKVKSINFRNQTKNAWRTGCRQNRAIWKPSSKKDRNRSPWSVFCSSRPNFPTTYCCPWMKICTFPTIWWFRWEFFKFCFSRLLGVFYTYRLKRCVNSNCWQSARMRRCWIR